MQVIKTLRIITSVNTSDRFVAEIIMIVEVILSLEKIIIIDSIVATSDSKNASSDIFVSVLTGRKNTPKKKKFSSLSSPAVLTTVSMKKNKNKESFIIDRFAIIQYQVNNNLIKDNSNIVLIDLIYNCKGNCEIY